MDAAIQPNDVEVHPLTEEQLTPRKEADMNAEALPLPVALRCEEISERDFSVLCRAATTTPSVVSRLKREPRRIPPRESVSVAD
jgi:hypothetical protein